MKKLDINKIINDRKTVLENRKTVLDGLKSSLVISDPIEFTVSEIAQNVNSRKKGEKVGATQLNFLENIKGSVVYVYELADQNIKQELLDRISAFRSKDNKDENGNDLRRSTAKIPSSAKANDSNVLYVGSVQEYIHSRTRQHLGFGHPHTFSLQIKHWALPNWKFRFYYIQVSNKEVTTDIEAALSNELNPLIGKREK